MHPMLAIRGLWDTPPPEPRTRMGNWPTVLFSWWCTSFAAVIIITRLLGRRVRSDRLFSEDWIMLFSLVPLFIRMIFIHFVLIYGTNNVDTIGYTFTEQQLYQRSIGSRLVLPARIFFAMFIWFNKLSVSEFLKRITIKAWRRSWEVTLQGIRIFLFLTFGAVVIATLTECQPFSHYWQVIPDPGPHCRLGFANLLTMGTCDIVTDVLLIAFPIPVVLKSGQSWRRKLQMVLLFSLSVVMIAVTATRMPQVIMHHGLQQYRTVWASCEILASAFVSNGVILGSMVRDKGTKRNKYRNYSISESLDRTSTRRTTVTGIGPTESDEDLFRSLGCRIPSHLHDQTVPTPRPAPPAMPAMPTHRSSSIDANAISLDTKVLERDSDDSMAQPVLRQVIPSPAPSTTRSASFFDVGSLLEEDMSGSPTRHYPWIESRHAAVEAHDFARFPPSPGNSRPGSSAFVRDIGGMLGDVRSPRLARHDSRDDDFLRSISDRRRSIDVPYKAPTGIIGPILERQETHVSLQDAGGLLSMSSEPPVTETSSHTVAEGKSAVTRPGINFLSSIPSLQESIELQDIGGLLSETNRREDRSAMSLREILQKAPAPQQSQPVQGRERGAQSSFDDMILSDPGGLMRN